jgi:hypothetical protein
VDVRGLEPLTPCLQTKRGKTLTALSGVAYTNQSAKFPLSQMSRSYAKNNPITYVDRDGHCGEPLSFVACVAVGAASAGYVVYKLHPWYKNREKAENEAFQKSLGCTASGAQCTEGEIRAYDKERLNTYGEGAVQAITNTMPSATPSTEIKDVVIDELKDRNANANQQASKTDASTLGRIHWGSPDCSAYSSTTWTWMASASRRFHFLRGLENPGPKRVLRGEVSNGSRNVETQSWHPII